MKESDRYHKWVEWSEGDQVYMGKCPDLVTGIHGEDPIPLYGELCKGQKNTKQLNFVPFLTSYKEVFMIRATRFFLLIAIAALAFSGAAMAQSSQPMSMAPTKAVAVVAPASGSSVKGTVTFTQEADGLHIVASLSGLAPGVHGFHIHEFGDVSAADGTSAGGHFNPAGLPHAGPDATNRHMGDLGNITADSAGIATLDRVDAHLSLSGPNAIVGRGVVVHDKADDLATQPTGNAGARIGVGVIGVAKK